MRTHAVRRKLLSADPPTDNFAVRLRTRVTAVVAVSTILLARLPASAWRPNRNDTDGLLRVVAQERMKADPSIRCVLLWSNDGVHDVEPAPSELLKRLRKVRPTVATLGAEECKDSDRSIEGVLLLGPVEWKSQPRTARVYVGYPGFNGRGGYEAKRGVFGRWQLTALVLD